MNKHQLQLAIYLSAILVSAGVFLPLTSFPAYGEVSYNRIAPLESWLVIFFAMACPGLILAGRARWCTLSPLAVWGVLLFPAIEDIYRDSTNSRLQQFGSNITSAMTDFASDLFFRITDFHWGGLVLLLALLVFSTSNLLYRFRT